MLAVKLDGPMQFDDYVISPKLDGIRCVIQDGLALSRTLKPIPNKFMQSILSDWQIDGFDGELIVGSPTGPDVYNRSNSGVMSKDGEPGFTYYVFDYITDNLQIPFSDRLDELHRRVDALEGPLKDHIVLVPHYEVPTHNLMADFEEGFLKDGYEGAMLRRLSSPYKCGRATLKQGWLLKLKRFADAEARIIGFECLYSNKNEATTDALGLTKRSSHKENQIPLEKLGSITAKDLMTGVEFDIGSGYTDKQRIDLWADRENLIGKLVKYKHFTYGAIDKPRFPTFAGFRSEIDL